MAPVVPVRPSVRPPAHPLGGEVVPALTAYDASYVALAEKLDVPLVTTDATLKRGRGARCVIELVG
ncbi:type II toxin-antitoxin system VapC family toxin [Streptomyces abyssalis]|uniref:type II toxin-antitoxin system VapC family toxin n=1 Tax=Streptomyces abyssalis TaxID=933944 RepID=UPI001C0A99C6|nr:type II toxin-antitoxin system VapC family toxin [Streptomyces abyssalis]